MTDYDDYEEAIAFEGDFEGETIITQGQIYSNGDIHIHQGPVTDDSGEVTEFRPDDIVGVPLDELKQIVEKAEGVVEAE